MALLFAVLGVGLSRMMEYNLYQAVDAALVASAKSIRDNGSLKGYTPFLMESLLQEFFFEQSLRSSAQLVDLSGKVSAQTPNLRVRLPVTPKAIQRARNKLETFETFQLPDKTFLRQVTLPVSSPANIFEGRLIQVGTSLEPTMHSMQQINLVLWLTLPFGLFLSILFGYFLTARSFRPVIDMIAEASKIGIDKLHLRLPVPPAKDELNSLANTFNALLNHLQESFIRLQRFAADVSHELRTPLTILRGEAELSLRKLRTPEEYQTTLRTILFESTHMTTIIEDLLLLARAQGRTLSIHWELLDSTIFFANLYASVQAFFVTKNITLTIDRNELSDFYASPGYLMIILKNILLNAAKHSQTGSAVTLTATAEENTSNNKKTVTFKIVDHGDGISQKDLPHIFDMFYRADTARNRKDGVGIGLSLALALTQLHDGEISVESKENEGSTFTVTISQPEPEQLPKATPT